MSSFFIRPDSPPLSQIPPPLSRRPHRPRPTVTPLKLNFDTSPSPPPTTTTTTTISSPSPRTKYLDSLIQICELKVQKLRLQEEEEDENAKFAYKMRILMSMR
ncbi:hypothetical protein Tsubulata_048487 [Turnera subulata]|uniref:Uncharacterized protein n=1 Tax=Turnera subulata TaxID=218843 RepID=A0A9Q0GE13_9ROSI|nr:hypothetical protein Tsubulata_020662 [Turnera subulata]KAJ4848508.1 hypothetical protein Tsubulata_048487 [Turnera subulata]